MKDIIVNKKTYHDYLIEDKYEAGIVLQGSEIKSIRAGKISIKESYISFVKNEAFIKGLHISQYSNASYNNHEEERDRKLLLHKREITKLSNKCKIQGYTCIPLKMYFNNGKVKVEIALAKGKTLYDKRESAKKKAMDMQAKQSLKR